MILPLIWDFFVFNLLKASIFRINWILEGKGNGFEIHLNETTPPSKQEAAGLTCVS